MECKRIGYDARLTDFSVENLWKSKRRVEFLLRPDIIRPRSTDAMVWPSIFDVEIGIGLSDPDRIELQLAGIPLPSWIGVNRPLWDDLGQLREYMSTCEPLSVPFCIIAVSLGCKNDESYPYVSEPQVLQTPNSWNFLGFDVSDASLLSGLTNCAYAVSEIDQMRPQWSQYLNEHHLFDSIEVAEEFCDLTNRRVPEHAPFYAFGIWRVQ